MVYQSMQDFQERTFVNKDGVLFTTRQHFVRFSEKHNSSRAKCYMVLYQSQKPLGVGELAALSGVDYSYIRFKVTKWLAWSFLKVTTITPAKGRPYRAYSLDDRGRTFVEQRIPETWLQRYAAEIREHRAISESA